MKTATQIRDSFLNYFAKHQHKRLPSASLVPEKDPTLFFTNAGMVPFKNVFTGTEDIGTRRATTSQKCMRVSGKHNDLENVGRTHRHHTFFEMLGNFSFGDYFKKDAITFAWEYLTEVMGLDKSRLWVTIYQEDTEAGQLWRKLTDVNPDRIIAMGEETNFWSMGATGPCGPCTEIHYDHGAEFGKDYEAGDDDFDGNRFMEIWNLVFMQFDRAKDGTLTALPKPSVDTGMGLERLACVVQGVHSNYDSDLFQPLLAVVAELAGKTYGAHETTDVSLRVVADHIRATSFLISDGVLPSNEGRGYVLRRIMRRAIRHGRLLGLTKPFFYQVAPVVITQMESAYPELKKNEAFILEVIRAEEERFLETLEKGLEIIEAAIAQVKSRGEKTLSGDVAFKLYDTYGFPMDLSETIAEEAGLHVDQAGFTKLMEQQRTQARASWKGSGQSKQSEVYQQLVSQGKTSEFVGYQSLSAESEVIALVQNGALVQQADSDAALEVYTKQTPFYGESGGQVGDQGLIRAASPQQNLKALVRDTQIPAPGLIAHHVTLEAGEIKVGDKVNLEVYAQTRGPTRLNHTATHLLHAALRQVLGEHVKQAGSLVAPHRLRFDFSHFQALSADEIFKVEDLVNEKIRADLAVEKNVMSYDEAMGAGAMALFGEKYGDEVRVLKIADFSTELCGGTHVNRTGEIGSFKIVSESSVASGVRRMDAVTGADTLKYLRGLETKLQNLAQSLKVSPEELSERVTKQSEELKTAQRRLSELQAKLASAGSSGDDPLKEVKEIAGVKVLALRRDVEDIKALRALSDQLLNRLQSGILVLAAAVEGKATLIVRVTKDLSKKFHAGNIVKALASFVGGSGGGRPDMAQAGGSKVEGLDEALKRVEEVLS